MVVNDNINLGFNPMVNIVHAALNTLFIHLKKLEMEKPNIPTYFLFTIFLVIFYTNGSAQGRKVTIYPAPASVNLSHDYKVSVEGKDVPVYMAMVGRADQVDGGNFTNFDMLNDLDTASFAYFDMNYPVTVSVKVSTPVTAVKILPLSAGIIPKINGKSVSFTMAIPKNLTVEINGRWIRSLHIFANPPETNVPQPNDTSVIYFGPGVHEVSQMTIGDNKTLYIAGGAVVHAVLSREEKNGDQMHFPPTFILKGKNITVRGRGIIDARLCPTHTRNMFLTNGSDIRFEGVILLDASTWFMPIRQSDHVMISNIKLIGYRSNSDGIDIVSSRDVTVENCFIRSSDDLIVIKSDRKQGKSDHIVARGCSLWNVTAHALSIGAEVREDVNDVLFTDCDVIHDTGREWSLRVYHSDSARVSNIRFENIRIEESHRFISLWIGQSFWSEDKSQRGQIQGVVFKDIKASGSPLTIDLVGADDKHGIDDVLFENVSLNGRAMTMKDVKANAFVKNIVIKQYHERDDD